jgi:hypothetical protein
MLGINSNKVLLGDLETGPYQGEDSLCVPSKDRELTVAFVDQELL